MKNKGNQGKHIELLAPAGNKEAFIAAVEAGADAIYCGGQSFNARMNAGNFGDEEMREAVAFAHKRGVRVHVTLNTLLKEEELAPALEYASKLYEMGVDALIVQDLGFAYLLKKHIPDFEMHLSTQGTIYDLDGVKAAAELGFDRVVLARELSLDEIRGICQESPVDIETFCHGAICMCYSGQCQMSRAIGGRSGNRGGCAQPCRLAYEKVDKDGRVGTKDYYLSPADMSFVDYLGELIDAGVMSFKIEGRMKSPEYVGIVTSIYRKYIDIYLKEGKYEVAPEDRLALLQIFNRGFTTHHLGGSEDHGFMSGDIPKNKGVKVGKVTNPAPGRNLIEIEAYEELHLGDTIEIRGKNARTAEGQLWTSVFVTFLETKGRKVLLGDVKSRVKAGDEIYRISSKEQQKEGEAFYKSKDWHKGKYMRRVPLRVEAEVRDGKLLISAAALGKEKVIEVPVVVDTGADLCERFRTAFGKRGDSPFAIEEIDIKEGLSISLPMSELNELRRKLYGSLEEALVGERPLPQVDWEKAVKLGSGEEKDVEEKENALELFFYTGASFRRFMETGEVEKVNELAGGCGEFQEKTKVRMLLPLLETEEVIGNLNGVSEVGGEIEILPYIDNVIRGIDPREIEGALKKIASLGLKKVYIGGIGWAAAVKDAGILPLVDFGINSYNPWTFRAVKTLGIERGIWSLETDGIFFGEIPLMIMEHKTRAKGLVDRMGAGYDFINRNYSNQTILGKKVKGDINTDIKEALMAGERGKSTARVFIPVES